MRHAATDIPDGHKRTFMVILAPPTPDRKVLGPHGYERQYSQLGYVFARASKNYDHPTVFVHTPDEASTITAAVAWPLLNPGLGLLSRPFTYPTRTFEAETNPDPEFPQRSLQRHFSQETLQALLDVATHADQYPAHAESSVTGASCAALVAANLEHVHHIRNFLGMRKRASTPDNFPLVDIYQGAAANWNSLMIGSVTSRGGGRQGRWTNVDHESPYLLLLRAHSTLSLDQVTEHRYRPLRLPPSPEK